MNKSSDKSIKKLKKKCTANEKIMNKLFFLKKDFQ